MKTISLKVPDSLDARLTAAARRSGASKSAITRDALEAHLKNGDQPPKGSALEMMGDLMGKYDFGPGDLSTNKKHMKGFGR